ncbi:YhgE/Pip domain-containing protein [Isoptericola sp. b490]|uniref:YhgE/Pip domain-containing protein n=1 Tax=Actinotalea lenta TaxID=3064654 RepID=UPI0027130613|nr:YhgE/Pip domain-containing protein [Isoptericola sp. b490]MDO8122388.1 YhgE/Pip domain-containing protein [Isoptericola sp. b490]
MPALTSTGAELRRFRRGPLPRVAILALVLIPLLYGALYLWAFWDPTGRMNHLPVALVNADRPATTADGSTLAAGDQVTDQLVTDGSLDWVTTSAADAAAGVQDGTYYFAVTIPTGFSAAVASAGGSDPHQARIDVTYNDANSFLASTLGHSAMVQVDDAVRATIGDRAVDSLLVGLGSARDGFATAADGAMTLRQATEQLASGADRVAAGADSAHAGAARLATGASTAADGASRLATGATTTADGATSLAGGAKQAASGAAGLSSGATTLAAGLSRAAAGAATLDSGATTLASGVDQAVGQVDALSQALAAAPGALQDVATYLGARAAAGDTAALAPLREVSDLATSLGDLDPRATATKLAALQAGAHDLADGAATLDTSMGAVTGGASDLADGAHRLAGGTAAVAAGASRLAGATTDLADGAHTLATGTAALADGATTLAAGTATLADGAHGVADGSAKVGDGTATLAAGLTDGAAAIPVDGAATARADVIATPVALDEQHLTEAQGFGEGFAPFFISLALFIGSLITWLLLRPLPTRALATPAGGLRAALAGYWPAATIGLAQVLVMLGVIHWGLGMDLASAVGTAAFTALVALSFLALQQMLNAVLGPAAGKVTILALLMLQLASSGGTYPVETTPAFFRAVHPLLPMSYAVTGLREVITGGVDARLWSSVAVLATLLVGSLALTAWRAGRMRTWTLRRLHPALSI